MTAEYKCQECGHELRRPEAAYLGQDVYELRVKSMNVNYRMLYFFHGRGTAVLSHGFVKKTQAVPQGQIDRAKRHRDLFGAAPQSHSVSM